MVAFDGLAQSALSAARHLRRLSRHSLDALSTGQTYQLKMTCLAVIWFQVNGDRCPFGIGFTLDCSFADKTVAKRKQYGETGGCRLGAHTRKFRGLSK